MDINIGFYFIILLKTFITSKCRYELFHLICIWTKIKKQTAEYQGRGLKYRI